MPSVIFKGDGWTTKNLRIKGQMQRKNERLDKKMMEMRGDGKYEGVVPNVAGERTDSWSDAQKLAKDRGLDAGSYDSIVDKERKGLTS